MRLIESGPPVGHAKAEQLLLLSPLLPLLLLCFLLPLVLPFI